MSRRETTEHLCKLLEQHIDPHNDPRIYWAKEVTFDYATNHSIRVDYMRFCPVNNSTSGIEKGDVYCYEVKSSVDDFRSKHGHEDGEPGSGAAAGGDDETDNAQG